MFEFLFNDAYRILFKMGTNGYFIVSDTSLSIYLLSKGAREKSHIKICRTQVGHQRLYDSNIFYHYSDVINYTS